MRVVLFCGGLGLRMRALVEDNGELRRRAADAPEADDRGRRTPPPLAHHEVVRPPRPHRIRALPRPCRRVDPRLLPLPEPRRRQLARLLASRSPRGDRRAGHGGLDRHDGRHRPRCPGGHASSGRQGIRRRSGDLPGHVRRRPQRCPSPGPDRDELRQEHRRHVPGRSAREQLARGQGRRHPVTSITSARSNRRTSGSTAASSCCVRRSSTTCTPGRSSSSSPSPASLPRIGWRRMPYRGFWVALDTAKDRVRAEELWETTRPWAIWDKSLQPG